MNSKKLPLWMVMENEEKVDIFIINFFIYEIKILLIAIG